MAAAAWVVGLDVEAAKTLFAPVHATSLHLRDFLRRLSISHHHDSTEVCEPVRREVGKRHRFHHRVRVALFDLPTEQLAQVRTELRRHLCRSAEGNDGRGGDSITQDHLFGRDVWWQRATRHRERSFARHTVNGRRSRII